MGVFNVRFVRLDLGSNPIPKLACPRARIEMPSMSLAIMLRKRLVLREFVFGCRLAYKSRN